MSNTIKQALSQGISITMDKKHAELIRRFCFMFETQGTNPEALNSPFLGIAKIFFLNRDQDEFLDIFGVSDYQIKKININSLIAHLSTSDIRKILHKLQVVDTSRKVQSDPFNIFIAYLLHLVSVTNGLTVDEKHSTKMALLKILQYKFFTSLVNHRFTYGADMAIMQATINNLSNKFSIVQYGTWKKVMEVRAEELISKTSIHYGTIENFNDDLGIFYLITDVQTRIRNQINIIVTQYYIRKEENDKVGSYGLAGNDVEGEKVILSSTSTLDSMTSNLSAEILSVYQFLDSQLIATTCSLFPGLRDHMFKDVLKKFSETALIQQKTGKLLEVKHIKNGEQYIGASILVRNIIQKTYRYCAQNNVNIKAKLAILNCAKDVYSSSRITDEDILSVRNSVGIFIDGCDITRREATKASLRIALILYIIIKSFKYI